MKNIINNPLIDWLQPVFAVIQRFISSEKNDISFDELRKDAFWAIERFEKDAEDFGYSAMEINTAKYVAIALIDETIAHSHWLYKNDWMSRPMQMHFFNQHRAGEEFFEKLAIHRQDGEPARNILEVCYICLELGFKGKYRVDGIEKLDSLKGTLRDQINRYDNKKLSELSTDGLPSNNSYYKVGFRHPRKLAIGGIVSACLIILLGINSYVGSISTQANNNILNYKDDIIWMSQD